MEMTMTITDGNWYRNIHVDIVKTKAIDGYDYYSGSVEMLDDDYGTWDRFGFEVVSAGLITYPSVSLDKADELDLIANIARSA